MFLSGFLGQEQAGGFDHHVSADFSPVQFSRVFDRSQTNLFAVDDQVVAFNRDVALEAPMHRVKLQHVSQVLWLQQVIDAHHFNVFEVLDGRTKHHAPNAAEAVDTNLDRHLLFSSS